MLTIEQVAKICHAANRAYCKSIGDFSIKNWEETEQHVKDSIKDGIKNIIERSITNPKESHESWLAFKIKEGGWKYGPIKNIEKKIHPCFMEYSQLPEEHRIKNEIFFSIVTTLRNNSTIVGEEQQCLNHQIM